MDYRTAWIYDPFYFSRYYTNSTAEPVSGKFFTSGEVFIPATPVFEPEELHCAYCKRKHGRGQETCRGCGAPL